MTWAISTFESGSSTAFVSQLTIALVGPEHAGASDTLWQMVATDEPLDDILDELSGQGLRGLPPFALVRLEDGGVRVVVRGAMVVEIGTADGVVSVEAATVRTWREEFVVAPETVRLIEQRESGSAPLRPFEVLAGVVPASSVGRDLRESDPRSDAAMAEWRSTAVEARTATPDVSEVSPDVEPAPVGDDENENEHDAHVSDAQEEDEGAPEDSDHTLTAADLDSAEPVWSDEPQPLGGGEPSAEPQPLAVAEPAEGNYDHLFGRTVKRTVEGAAVRLETSGEDASLIDAIPPITPPPPPTDPSSPPPPPPSTSASIDQLGDHDGHTISRAQLAAMQSGSAAQPLSQPPSQPVAPGAPTVSAVMCVAGHPNPPQSASCRICGAAPATGAPVSVPRPPLGVIVLSTGDRIVLDRPVVIGRNPKIGPSSFGELPRLIKLDSAGPGLSRTHAEIRIEQWQVLLVDTRSSNGTELTLPGQPPRRLHADEAVGLVPGAYVDLGGEVTFVVEEVT